MLHKILYWTVILALLLTLIPITSAPSRAGEPTARGRPGREGMSASPAQRFFCTVGRISLRRQGNRVSRFGNTLALRIT